jgi:hypothetical protein
LVAVELISCKTGERLTAMPSSLLQRLKGAAARAEIQQDAALTPPPWEALLALRFEDGRTLFGQIVRSDRLRLSWERQCPLARSSANELWWDEEQLLLFSWMREQLGPTKEKAHLVPKNIPPPPGL